MDWASIPKEAYGLAGVVLGGAICLVTTLLYQWRQSMCALTWQASQDNVTQAMIDDYHAEVHAMLPKVIGGKIMVAALDPDLGYQLDVFVDLAREVDEKIGVACLAYAKDNAAGIEQLKSLKTPARDFDEIVYRRLSELGGNQSLGKWMLRKWSASRTRRKVNLEQREGR
jgi:hypothetical protein